MSDILIGSKAATVGHSDFHSNHIQQAPSSTTAKVVMQQGEQQIADTVLKDGVLSNAVETKAGQVGASTTSNADSATHKPWQRQTVEAAQVEDTAAASAVAETSTDAEPTLYTGQRIYGKLLQSRDGRWGVVPADLDATRPSDQYGFFASTEDIPDEYLEIGAIIEVDRQIKADGTSIQTFIKGLAEANTIEQEIYELYYKNGVPTTRSAAAMKEVETFIKNQEAYLYDPRVIDMTHRPVFAIDYPTTNDRDQAKDYEKKYDTDGNHIGYITRIFLVDPTVMKPGTAIFDDILQSGGTYYSAAQPLTMLPEELIPYLSLDEGKDRRAVMIEMHTDLEMNADWDTLKVANTRIRSHADLNYQQVQDMLDGKPVPAIEGTVVEDGVRLWFEEMGPKLYEQRLESSAPFTQGEEVNIHLENEEIRFHRKPHRLVDSISAEMYLLKNQLSGAVLSGGFEPDSPNYKNIAGKIDHARLQELQSRGIFPIYRNHRKPKAEHIQTFGAFLEELKTVYSDLEQLPKVHDIKSFEKMVQWLSKNADKPKLKTIIEQLNIAAIRVNQGARIEREVGGHYGLGLAEDQAYARVTAPMRETISLADLLFVNHLYAEAPDGQEPIDGLSDMTAAQAEALFEASVRYDKMHDKLVWQTQDIVAAERLTRMVEEQTRPKTMNGVLRRTFRRNSVEVYFQELGATIEFSLRDLAQEGQWVDWSESGSYLTTKPRRQPRRRRNRRPEPRTQSKMLARVGDTMAFKLVPTYEEPAYRLEFVRTTTMG